MEDGLAPASSLFPPFESSLLLPVHNQTPRLKASSARRDRRRHEEDIVRERNFAQEASTITPGFSGLRLGEVSLPVHASGLGMPPGYLLTACGYRFDQSRTS
jgi:hypothetical protein